MGRAAVAKLAAHLGEQAVELGCLGVVEAHNRDAVTVVEEHPVAADFRVMGFDAEEVGVELEDEAAHQRTVGQEPKPLVGDEEPQRVGAEGVLPEVDPAKVPSPRFTQ